MRKIVLMFTLLAVIVTGCGGSEETSKGLTQTAQSIPKVTTSTVAPIATTTAAPAPEFTNYGLIVELTNDLKIGNVGYEVGMDFYSFESNEDQVRVLLPYNGETAWLDRSDVTTKAAEFKIEVDLSDHKMDVLLKGETIYSFDVGVGVEDSPTPTGWFYVWEHQVQIDPTGAYGPHAFGISAFSDAEDVLPGGEGRIGFHGTNNPEILPGDVSHGCIRLNNEDVIKLVGLFPLGTPVEIVA